MDLYAITNLKDFCKNTFPYYNFFSEVDKFDFHIRFPYAYNLGDGLFYQDKDNIYDSEKRKHFRLNLRTLGVDMNFSDEFRYFIDDIYVFRSEEISTFDLKEMIRSNCIIKIFKGDEYWFLFVLLRIVLQAQKGS